MFLVNKNKKKGYYNNNKIIKGLGTEISVFEGDA